MKQFSLLVALFCCLAGTSYAVNITGKLTNTTTSSPLSGQLVYVMDSMTNWSDSTLTNSTGDYTFTIPTGAAFTGNGFLLFTRACGAYNQAWAWYSSTGVSANLAVACGTPFTIHGSVTLGGVANSGPARVYLITKTLDVTLMDTVLTAIDSFNTGTGGTYSKSYAAMPAGTLLLKAALLPAHSSYWSYVPTYYVNALVWSNALALNSSNFNASNLTNINMISGTNSGGPGFIGGQVLLGANKTSGVGDPLSSRMIILTNSTGTPIRYTYSDASGHYSFSNLAVGTYKLFGDAWGKTNPAFTLTLTATKPTVNNLTFEENSSSFFAHFGGLGITASQLKDVAVYPNPVTDRLYISGLNSIEGAKSVVLSDLTGATIQSQTYTNGQSVELSTTSLVPGIYMLHLTTEAGSASFRIVK
jgi:hypothetical protein